MHIFKAELQRRNLIAKQNELEEALAWNRGSPPLIREHLRQIDEDLIEVEDYLDSLQGLEPASYQAVMAGCTCRKSSVDSASLFPPEPILDRTCPLHGPEHGE